MLQTRLGLAIKLLSIILIPDAKGRRRNETVHASIVCMGNCLEIVTPLINSLLYKHNRLSPISIDKPRYHYTIHFHILVDDSTAKGTIELCSAMKSNAMCTIYNENQRLPGLGWLTNLHYAGVFDFIKLLLPEILRDLDKVIVIDYDLIFMCDIIELWDVFKKMKRKQIFGLVEEHSDWYINGFHGLAQGVGFNLGVWLWDLKKTSKTINWARTWQDHVNATQPVRNAIELGAQDVINGIVKKNPGLLYKMDCRFNVQLTGVSTAKKLCYGDISNIKVIHYNTRSKFISNDTADYDYFNAIKGLFS